MKPIQKKYRQPAHRNPLFDMKKFIKFTSTYTCGVNVFRTSIPGLSEYFELRDTPDLTVPDFTLNTEYIRISEYLELRDEPDLTVPDFSLNTEYINIRIFRTEGYTRSN